MDYITNSENGQLLFSQSEDFLKIPSRLTGFTNDETTVETAQSGREVFCFHGHMDITEDERICSCGCRMHKNGSPVIKIRHLNFGSSLSCVIFPHHQLFCPKCGATKSQFIPFKSDNHLISRELHQYVMDLLAHGKYTNKSIAEMTGLNQNTVKAIDLKRLRNKYTIDGEHLKKPTKTTKVLGIDEFKLHNGRKYATHIIDMETGHILWIANGKTKQVVYDFIKHVGLEWMDSVEAVACDMNSDFQEAFEDKCPHIQVVFDHFHIVKNFNDKVVSEVRKDEQRRLIEEGNDEAARALKRTRYILMSNRKTLQKKDAEAENGTIIHKGSPLFGTENVTRKGGKEEKYDTLIRENKLLFTVDLVKEKLQYAYTLSSEAEMAREMTDIIDICNETGNKHFKWFGKLIYNHFEGIIAHATFKITSGKVEGINNKIKTLRRQGYGYPDDEYFFLKIIDMSLNDYVRNPKSHKICD